MEGKIMKNIKQKIGLIGGVSGAILVSLGYCLEPNIIWLISNIVMLSYFISKKERELSLQMTVYICIAIYGIINLGILK